MAEQGIPLIGPLLNRLIGTRNDRFVKKYTQRTNAITDLEAQVRQLTDAEIRNKFKDFRDRLDQSKGGGEDKDLIMIEAFAVAREAMDRAVGIRNIFNPKYNFDPSQLPSDMQGLYAKLKAEMDATPPAPPVGEWLGNAEPIPGWMQVDIPPSLYDAVRALYVESRPPFRARPFDVQLIGGMVLCQGKIAEMKTGEGKTIVGPLACYMAAIERMKVHVVTVNDYLVQRDRDWTFPYFHALGLTVGAIHPQHMQDEDTKRQMYRCDVVYGTTSEFGFDYLRDNMKRRSDEQVQKARQFAIVDEVDSILIDEARTPLIISGQAHDDQPRYELADKLARHLVAKQEPWNKADKRVRDIEVRMKQIEGEMRTARDKGNIPAMQKEVADLKLELPKLKAERDAFPQYYEVKLERKSAHLTHEGVSEAQRAAGIGSFYIEENMDLPHLLEQSLRAHTVYELDKDYIVRDMPDQFTQRPVPNVIIVDQNTGRAMVGRQWSDGLHQAVECKEKVPIKAETQTVATITIQNFFKMYKRLAGMTGTADTEAQEFHDIYKLDVVAIPTNKQVRRADLDDIVFMSGKDKWNAITDEIKYFHDIGRPVLVGTTSVEKSESLSKLLTQKHQVQHEVLNAKQHDREAHIVENAGQIGAVMIATNMAGRGTDIKLGKISRQQLLDHWLRRNLAPAKVTPDSTDEQLREGIFRKIAPRELGIDKKQAESMSYEELELSLLRNWAAKYTWLTPKQADTSGRDELISELDGNGRFLLHRIRWFDSIEDMGGLHVLGTERHESRRIDNQLRGRAGRQGDRGSSRFYVSLEDELMQRFGGETQMKVLSRLGMKEGDAISHPWLTSRLQAAQRKVEEYFFQMRKNVLEYDEVMEHQRQFFYGLRQRVLEGRDVRGLVFDFIRQTTNDAVEKYLDDGYPAECAAEYAKGVLDCSISADRLKGRTLEEMEHAIRDEAAYEARQTVNLTLGEYMPVAGSEVNVDFDPTGLVKWAKTKFGVDLDASRLKHATEDERRYVQDALVDAAEARVQTADLSGLAEFTQKNYGEQELAAWVKEKLGFDISVEEFVRVAKEERPKDAPHPVTSMLMQRVEQWYHRREVEYPVEYGIGMFQSMARTPQVGPQEAAKAFLNWANGRFNVGWTPDLFKTSTMQTATQQLLDASKSYVEEKKLEQEIDGAIATKSDAELETYLKNIFGEGFVLPESMKHLQGEERMNMIRSRIESARRFELLHFERTILLDVMDNQWRDHLYSMDQLRDTIGFRSFSQNDPRIEYKREGSQMFKSVIEQIRLRVTELVFRARIAPPGSSGGGGGGGSLPVRPITPRPMTAPVGAPALRSAPPSGPGPAPGTAIATPGGGMISGPNLGVSMAGPNMGAPVSPQPRPDTQGGSQML